MGKIFCIMGKSASGKDTIYKKMLNDDQLGLKKVVPYTTRPIRVNEQNGTDYYFVSDSTYEQLMSSGKVFESRTYQTVHGPWHYFTANDGQIDLNNGNYLLIGTLETYVNLKKHFDEDELIPIYVEVEDGVRLERAMMREKMQTNPDYAEMCRRFLSDCDDFSEKKLEQANIKKRYENIHFETCCDKIREDMLKYCTSKK